MTASERRTCTRDTVIKKKITINELAREAGVSKTTVSFAFNNPEKISPETRARIAAIADRLGYIPNPVARTLTTNRIGSIGLLLPQDIHESFQNPFISEFLQGLGSVCVDEELSVTIVTPLAGDINKSIRNAAVDGFVALGLEERMTTFQVLKDRRLPFVCVDVETPPDIPSVKSDDGSGTRALMEHLLGHGHSDIVILSFKPAAQYHENRNSLVKDIRLSGYLEAYEAGGGASGIGGSPARRNLQVLECLCSERGGFEAMREMHSAGKRPTAVVCLSDVIALGVMRYCFENRISIPGDVSITGFDDIAAASLVRPALTTVSQQILAKGKTAGRMVIDLMKKREIALHCQLETSLCVRESTGTARACLK